MDGVHDLGGMQGFGPVEREDKEPVFHAHWEAEVLAMIGIADKLTELVEKRVITLD